MAMNPLISLISSSITLLIIAIFFLLISSSYCLNHKQYPQGSYSGLLVEEKTRLGSTPPRCHNKCNQCHPCMAVQVPPEPSHRRVQPQQFDSAGNNRYSNYKPLGWKCRCNGNFYNP